MKFCSKCGAEIADEAVICVNCGCSQESFTAPTVKPTTNRGAVKTILLTIVTLGIYSLVLYYRMSEELNITASKYDGLRTMNYLLVALVLSPITLGVALLVWFHKFSTRIGSELKRRNINYVFGAGTFWGWCILGAVIIVGPLIYLHKVTTAMNMINEDYNAKG